MKNTVYILCAIMIIFFNSCRNHQKTTKNYLLKYNGGIIIKMYDIIGNLQSIQYFNNDTIPNGPKIKFFLNGKISSWVLYKAKYKEPLCGIFYNVDGSVDTLKGSPLLDDGYRNSKGETYIQLIKPPQLSYIIEYVDFYGNKLMDKLFYKPVVTDSNDYIILNNYNYINTHKYYLIFCVVDSTKQIFLHQYPYEINVTLNDK